MGLEAPEEGGCDGRLSDMVVVREQDAAMCVWFLAVFLASSQHLPPGFTEQAMSINIEVPESHRNESSTRRHAAVLTEAPFLSNQ